MNFDTIIIGAGLGGLTAGATLARQEKKVLVLEQHYIPGGCATTFKRKDYIMEVGLHEMDGLHDLDTKKQIFELLDVFKNVDLVQVPELFRLKSPHLDFTFPHGQKEATQALVEQYPADEKGIQAFMNLIEGVLKEIPKIPSGIQAQLLYPLFPLLFPNIVQASKHTVGSWLDKNIQNEVLKIILQGNLTYYHDDPYGLSMTFFAAAQGGYIGGGGYFIKGGSQQLSNYLASEIERNGGTVLLGKKVNRILVKNNKVIGVAYQDAYNTNLHEQEVFAQNVVGNASPTLIKDMLPESQKSKLGTKIDHLTPSCSLISLYLGFNTDLKKLGLKHYSTFVYDEEIKSLKDIQPNYKGSWEKKTFVFVDYSQIDANLAPKGKSVGAICTTDYLSNWENLSPEAYKKEKERVAQVFIQRLEATYPGISQHLEHYEVGTAKTIQRYTWNHRGTPYGYEQSKKQSGLGRLQSKSGIPNLYFASAWSMPGGGFTGAIIGGFLTATEIQKKYKSNLSQATRIEDARKVKLVAKKEVAENTLELTFEKPKGYAYQAGQYAVLRLENPKFKELDMPFRSLSMVSHPEESTLRFAMRKSESSFKKSCDAMPIGEAATIFGPMGNFGIQRKEQGIVFIIAGIGITPIIPLLKELQQENFAQPVYLFYCNKSEEQAAYHQELQNIELPHFQYHPVFTHSQGRINSHTFEVLGAMKNYDYYLVGTSPFLKAMQGILEEKQVPSSQVIVDDFG